MLAPLPLPLGLMLLLLRRSSLDDSGAPAEPRWVEASNWDEGGLLPSLPLLVVRSCMVMLRTCSGAGR